MLRQTFKFKVDDEEKSKEKSYKKILSFNIYLFRFCISVNKIFQLVKTW